MIKVTYRLVNDEFIEFEVEDNGRGMSEAA